MTDTRPLPRHPDGRAVSLIFGLAVVAVTVAALRARQPANGGSPC